MSDRNTIKQNLQSSIVLVIYRLIILIELEGTRRVIAYADDW